MIGPGIPNPMLFAGGDPLDELGKIERSVRFRAAASPYLSWTPSVAGNRTVWTWFGWLKPAQITEMVLFLAGGTSQNFSMLSMHSGGSLRTTNKISDVYSTNFYTSNLIRDPAAHCHVVIARNGSTTHRIWVNGGLFGDVPSPSGANSFFNSVTAHYIGRRPFLSNSPIDGQLAHCGWVDGQALTPSAFGQFHPRTGQWRPKTKAAIRAAVAAGGGARNGWGTNGFFLTFDDVTSLTTLCYDRSQSDTDTTGNNWTATNISLTAGPTYDSMLDTPTNVFPTLNPLWKEAGVTIADGNLSVFGGNRGGVATFPMPKGGRFQCEATVTATVSTQYVSIFKASAMSGNLADIDGGSSIHAYSYYPNGTKYVKSVNSAYGASWGTVGDVIGIDADLAANTVTFYRNGVSQGAITIDGGIDYFFGCSNATAGAGTLAFNFGQRPFAYPIAGAKPLCTKNLPIKPAGPMKSSNAFVAVTDSGANIAATLAAARAGWSDYIDIIKRRDASEGWRWIFSDDAANYLDSSSTAAKAAVPAFGGTSYVGYALKVAASNGVATGRLVHTNGVASVVTDGLANSRKMVILKNEATGNWFFYHPDLTAGKLLYLNTTAAETTDATINSVTASGFTVAAALASGTYRWIALAEVDGFFKLGGKYTGTSSTNGPFLSGGITPQLTFVKSTNDAAGDWIAMDQARSTWNPANKYLMVNTPGLEGTAALMDLLSNGTKLILSDGDTNLSTNQYVWASIAAFPFRYANAR